MSTGEITDECTICREKKGNVYLQFIMQSMQDFDLTRILGCRKVKDSAQVMGLNDWKCRAFIPSDKKGRGKKPSRKRSHESATSPRLQFGQKEVGHFWDAATRRQEWDLHSWTKKEPKRGQREISQMLPYTLKWNETLVVKNKLESLFLKITAWSCCFPLPWKRFSLSQNRAWQKWFCVP